MEARLLDAFLAPTMVSSIMFINLIKQLKLDEPQLLYITVTIGTILSSIHGLLHLRINRSIRDRRQLTLTTALLLTATSFLSIIGFHIIRVNVVRRDTYKLPTSIQGHVLKDGSSIFHYHFFADFIPGLIIFTQSQVCFVVKSSLLNKAKRKFTLGEASIVAQLASAAYLTWALVTYTNLSDAGPFQVQLTTNIILNIGVSTFLIAFLPSYLIKKARTTSARYALLGLLIAVSFINIQSLISTVSNLDPATWLVDHIFASHQRISLFSLWLSTLAACVGFSTSWSRMVGQTNSLVRKIFHLAICVVFITGYNQDINFTRFAAGGILVVLFILELIRAWQLKPIGHHLERVCQALRGKWDNRYITLSHIYLLVGTFLPLWLLPVDSDGSANKLALSCGLISVGIGDTAAALVGTFLGRTKLREKSGKTLEGLLGNISAMIVFKLLWIGYMDFVTEFSFILAVVFTAIVEAVTSTCDNLILPLVMLLMIEIN